MEINITNNERIIIKHILIEYYDMIKKQNISNKNNNSYNYKMFKNYENTIISILKKI